MESQLLAFCRQREQGSGNALDETEALPIEAAWDLDD
jgi:hypothetical protein